jgi:ferredoxin/flavodoxin
MDYKNGINQVEVVYFSGTGGTKRIADAYEKDLNQRNKIVTVKNLGAGEVDGSTEDRIDGKTDLILLLFPVYAFDAPKPVYHWIESLDDSVAGKKVAVISVSGGGEVWPNTGCRNNCCKKLEGKGLEIVYDNMMCMPANMMAEVSDHLAMRLIRIIPEKVEQSLNDILTGRIKRTHFHKSPLRNFLTKMENENAGRFAQGLTVSQECTGCGWCAKNCPMENITIEKQTGKPLFSSRCTICMRCIYGCPNHALNSRSSMVFKKGFDLDAVEKRMEGVELDPVEKCCKGIMFLGVKDYLRNKY